MRFSKLILIAVIALGLWAVPPGGSLEAREDGVEVGNPSLLRKLVPASKMEEAGALQYRKMTEAADRKGQLLPNDHPQVVRVRTITRDLLPHAAKFNDRAGSWKWKVAVVDSRQINAFCLPGGKIVIFTGIIERLKLTDDEVAMIIGHEIAHALREHARERTAKGLLTNVGATALGWLTGSSVALDLARMGGGLLTLKFSRDDETEADLIGMELAARAGFDPRAAVSLWQKMGRAAQGAPPEFLSTHPSGESRIKQIQGQLEKVMPIYEANR